MARKIAVEIVGDSRSLERAFKRSAGAAGRFDKQIGKTGGRQKVFGGLAKGAGLLTGALGVGGLSTAVKASFDEMADAQKVSAQTAAVLKSTRGAANVTAGQVDKLATSLGNMSGVDDEAIKSGENLLLTFTNIKDGVGKNDKVFSNATGTMLDMSTALGQDTKTSAMQLGKALNDPVKGVTSLRRVGVQFTDAQQKQIDAMVKSGDTMGAQKIILQELNREFGGSAKAAGDTLPGQLNKLKETAKNLGGEIATTLSPMIQDAADKMTKWLQDGDNQKDVLDTIKGAAKLLGDGIGFLRGAFRRLSSVVGGNKNAIKLLIGMYAGFKAVQIAGRVSTLVGSFRNLRGATRRATTATGNFKDAAGKARGSAGRLRGSLGNLKGSMIGKAGLVGAVGLASYELATMALKATKLDKKLYKLGGTAYDTAAKLGLIEDPMKAFEGKDAPGQKATAKIRRQAAQMQRRGVAPLDRANALRLLHPEVAWRDLKVLAGAAAPRGGAAVYHINNLHVGANNPRQFEEQLHKRAKRRPHPRRG